MTNSCSSLRCKSPPNAQPEAVKASPPGVRVGSVSKTESVKLVQVPKKASEATATTYFRPDHSEIRFGKMRFLITDRPNEATLESYAKVSCSRKCISVMSVASGAGEARRPQAGQGL